MADPQITQKTTGYLLGEISPLGQKNACRPLLMSKPNNLLPFIFLAGKED